MKPLVNIEESGEIKSKNDELPEIRFCRELLDHLIKFLGGHIIIKEIDRIGMLT
jgi:hypothetical protein